MNDLTEKLWAKWQQLCCRWVHPMADGWPAFWLLLSATAFVLWLIVSTARAA